jgi:zinc and cadmium transporter
MSIEMWLYSLLSVFVVSLISLVGVLTLSIKERQLRSVLLLLVSFSAGGLFGDAFIHLIPEAAGESGFGLNVSFYILVGIMTSFIVEKLLCWRHCHIPTSDEHPHPFAYMNLFGDSVHNFIDGLIIAGSYLVNLQLGLATTLAVVFHEIPQEIGDFGILLYGGFKKSRALLLNFLTALTAVLGALVALSLGFYMENFTVFLVPFAAGGFIYIAGSDLIPEMHKEVKPLKSVAELTAFILGILVLLSLTFLE